MSEATVSNCSKCEHPLSNADKLGSSYVCPKCGGVTRPGDPTAEDVRRAASQLSPKRLAARSASRVLFGLLVSIPVVAFALFRMGEELLDDPERAYGVAVSGSAVIICLATTFAHRLRDAAAKEDGRPYWENLL